MKTFIEKLKEIELSKLRDLRFKEIEAVKYAIFINFCYINKREMIYKQADFFLKVR